jgi:hypothetical protein
MSATLAPPTTRHSAELRHAPLALAEATGPAVVIADPAATEMRRWLIGLGTPFALGAVFFALAIGTSTELMIAPALLFGPMLFMFMTIYLLISSDSNGAPPEAASKDRPHPAVLVSA